MSCAPPPWEPELAATPQKTRPDGANAAKPEPHFVPGALFSGASWQAWRSEAPLNKCGQARMQIGCSEELISECEPVQKQEKRQNHPQHWGFFGSSHSQTNPLFFLSKPSSQSTKSQLPIRVGEHWSFLREKRKERPHFLLLLLRPLQTASACPPLGGHQMSSHLVF